MVHAAEVPVAVGLVLAVRAQQVQPHRLGDLLERLAGEALVGEQDLSGADQPMLERWPTANALVTASEDEIVIFTRAAGTAGRNIFTDRIT